jgi:vitamin B12 transporter
MLRIFRPAALGLAALPLFASFASAQTTVLPDVVISANQVPQPADRVGASVTVLHGEELRAKGVETVADALREVPGVHVNQAGSKGALTQVRIRGADGNHLQVLIDGIPVSRLDAGDYDFADLLMDDIERIEVVRGPQSGIYGGNAHAGVISIFTISGRGLKHPELVFRTEGGNKNSHFGSLSLRAASGLFYGAFTMQSRKTDGFNISRLGNEKDGHGVTIFNFKSGVDLTENLNVEGVFRHTKRKLQFDPEAFPFPGGVLPDGDAFDRFTQTNARVNTTLTSLDGRLTQRFGFFQTSQDYSDSVPAFGPVPFQTFGRGQGADYKASLQYAFGPVKNTSTIVIDTLNEGFRSRSAFGGSDEKRNRIGTAYEHIFDFATGLTVSGALRQDFHDQFADFFTWRLALSQRLPTNTRLHSNIGKGVTLPNFNEMFAAGAANFIPNPNLKPESSVGWDFGIEQTFWNGKAIFDVTYFASRLEDRITRIPAPGPSTTVVNVAGVSPRQGVELTGTLLPWTWLKLQATYTYTDSETPAGIREVRRPANAATFTSTFIAPDNKTKASVTVIHNGKMDDDQFFGGPLRVTLSEYTIVNAKLSYDLTPTSQIYIRGENILNEKYEEVFSYRSPGATVLLGLRMRLGELATPIQ